MKKIILGIGGVIVIVFGVFLVQARTKVGVSPCTGTEVPIEQMQPCLIGPFNELTHDTFVFTHPDNAGTSQSSEGYAQVNHESSEEDDSFPFYRISFYYNEHVTREIFDALYPDATSVTLDGRAVLRTTNAIFPDPSYSDTIAYYAEVEGNDVMIVIASFSPEQTSEAEEILKNGFRWR